MKFSAVIRPTVEIGMIGQRYRMILRRYARWQVQITLLVSLLCLSLVACQPASEPEWRWERAETELPHQMVVLAVAADPGDPDRLWAGYYARNGLIRSEDGGQSWRADTVGLAESPVFDLLFVPGRSEGPGILWAAVRPGLAQSFDDGITWRPVEGLPAAAAFALGADAGGRVYVGLDGAGIYAQTDDGLGWTSLAVPLSPLASRTGEAKNETSPLASAAVLSLAAAPDGQQLYAGTAGRGLFASRDGGRSWSAAFPGEYVPNVALHPGRPEAAIASLRRQLVRTLDGGESWQEVPVAWAGDEVVSLLWLADGTLGAGTGKGRLYRSTDGGETWVEGGTGLPPRGGVLDLAIAGPAASGGPTLLLAGTWTGLYGSHDGGESWRDLYPALGVPNAYTVLSAETGLLLGTRAGLFRWQPEAHRWRPVPAEFPSGGIQSLAEAPSNRQTLYAGAAAGGVYRSDDGGKSWQRTPSLGVGIPAIAVNPKDAGHVYILAAWERVYESRDGGQSWQARWEGLGETVEAVSIAVDPVTPGSVYVGAETGLYRSDNGRPWEPIAPALADQTVLAILAQLAPRSTGNGTALYLGATRGLYRSVNKGSTTEQGLGPVEDVSVTALLADPIDPRRLYAGTAYEGLYRSSDWGKTWQVMGGPAELREEVITGLAWGPEGELFVVALGGVWAGSRP